MMMMMMMIEKGASYVNPLWLDVQLLFFIAAQEPGEHVENTNQMFSGSLSKLQRTWLKFVCWFWSSGGVAFE